MRELSGYHHTIGKKGNTMISEIMNAESPKGSTIFDGQKLAVLARTPDALTYGEILRSSWKWTHNEFNPQVRGWKVLHGLELWDCSGLDSVKFLFEIPTSFGSTHFLYVYVQQGDFLQCTMSSCLQHMKYMLQPQFKEFEDSEKRHFKEFFPGNSPRETDLQTS